MAYDEHLSGRVSDLLHDVPIVDGRALTERRMFGGLAFLVDGNMAVAASDQGIMVRVDPAETDHLVGTTAARPTTMGERTMRGWVRLTTEDVAHDRDLRSWVARGASYAASLPAK